MRLISCTIENFGKLNNVTYDFSGECNTICEDNGWGKSTLAAFIRVMFYGFKNESKKKLADKERNRYMPWQKGVYGGEIIFKVNDNTTFGLKKVESSGTDKKVTVTFENGRISTTDAVLPSMFELKDENKNIVKVVKVEKDTYNSNVLILTTDKTFTGDISCTINNEVVDDATGYTVQLLDSVGHLFQTNANKALNVQNLETSVSDDDVSEEYEELEEIEF